MSLRESYDDYYRNPNYFSYHEWIYRRYIATLLAVAQLRPGSSVLDVGCGQGFFSSLLQRCGMKVYGIDLSEVGVRCADRAYGFLGARFIVADATRTPFGEQFDCVFTRSLSLYNSATFSSDSTVTDVLLYSVKENGCLLFLYNTNLARTQLHGSWRYHSLENVREHFSTFRNPQIFLVNRLHASFVGKRAFSNLSTRLNSFISSRFDIGADLVCILRKE